MTVARLRKRAEFVRMNTLARKAATPGLVLQSMGRDDGRDELRVGFTVTKKVGNAVTRNRVRRRLREAARLAFGADAPRGLDLVLIGRAGTVGRPFRLLRADLDAALRRTGSRQPDPARG